MLKNFLDNIGTWLTSIIGSITAIVIAAITIKKSKASKKVEEVDGEAKSWELKKNKEQYYNQQSEAYQLKIDMLTEKLDKVTGNLKEMQQLHDDSLMIIEELKAELNMYKTTKIA